MRWKSDKERIISFIIVQLLLFGGCQQGANEEINARLNVINIFLALLKSLIWYAADTTTDRKKNDKKDNDQADPHQQLLCKQHRMTLTKY